MAKSCTVRHRWTKTLYLALTIFLFFYERNRDIGHIILEVQFYLTDEIVPHIGISSLHKNNTNPPLKTYAVLGHYLGAWKRLPITSDHLRVDQPYIALSSLRWRKATRGWSYLYSIITTRIDHCLKPNVRPVPSKPVMPQSLLRKENYCRIIDYCSQHSVRWKPDRQVRHDDSTTYDKATSYWNMASLQKPILQNPACLDPGCLFIIDFNINRHMLDPLGRHLWIEIIVWPAQSGTCRVSTLVYWAALKLPSSQ